MVKYTYILYVIPVTIIFKYSIHKYTNITIQTKANPQKQNDSSNLLEEANIS